MAAKKSSFTWTAEQVRAHCARTGENPAQYLGEVTGHFHGNGRYTMTVAIDATKPFKEKSGPQPNKTEARYGRILESRKLRGEISRYRFAAMRLLWGDTMRYLGDWVITNLDGSITIVEVKGPHIFQKDKIRFLGCKAEWPEFKFEMHQENKDRSWTRIY